jgi:hypothetical protein
MQITINVPDNLPSPIVQQYIHNIEAQMRLMAELANNTLIKNKPASFEQILQIATECANLPVLDSRSPDEILGYDDSPFGLFGDNSGH